jgi:large subunit ribosomal protein L36e
MLDIIRTGGTNWEKRMYKFAKRRLGTHSRAHKKKELMIDANRALKAKAAGN